MKKSVLFAAALFTVTAASAQTGEITSAKGENWLSQDGDWGLSFNAQPLLNYAGNLFNAGTNNNTLQLNGGSWTTFLNLPSSVAGTNVIIAGKKLIDANTAYRGKLRIGFGSNKVTDLVLTAPAPNPQTVPPSTVEDVTKSGYTAIGLGAGMEKRVGSTRVVGVYGAEFGIAIGSSKVTTEYGNAISAQNPVASRTTETKNGSTMGLGLNAFAGIEWFFAPKISIGGEFTWGLNMASRGTPEVTTEGWDPTANNNAGAVVTTTTTGDANTGNADKTNAFSIDTGVSGAEILLNFYFQ